MTLYIETKEAVADFRKGLGLEGSCFNNTQIDVLTDAFRKGIESYSESLTVEINEMLKKEV